MEQISMSVKELERFRVLNLSNSRRVQVFKSKKLRINSPFQVRSATS